ncbi:MAG: histidine phosphatase family protein [Ruminococcaceae bacterium]|nr:histidine phosphatase family protein [Oscillospiraceae bacterium]
MTRLIVVRHGRSEANISRMYACHTDTPLSDFGRRQAELLADHLVANEQIDAVYASDLSRAADTVRPTAARLGLSVITTERLREIKAGQWENLPYDELQTTHAAAFQRFKDDPLRAGCPDGESVRDVYARVIGYVKELAEQNEGKTLLIGSHWYPVLSLVTEALFGSAEGLDEKNGPKNASIQILRYEKGRFIPELINYTDHLADLSSAAPMS